MNADAGKPGLAETDVRGSCSPKGDGGDESPRPECQERVAARAAMREGKFDRAETALRRAIEWQPGDASAHHDLGVTLARQAKLSESIACFEKALELKPDAADTVRNLGVTLARMNRADDAEAKFRRAVELDPESAQCRHDWANSLKTLGKLEEAAKQYREAIRLLEAKQSDQARRGGPHPSPPPEGEGANRPDPSITPVGEGESGDGAREIGSEGGEMANCELQIANRQLLPEEATGGAAAKTQDQRPKTSGLNPKSKIENPKSLADAHHDLGVVLADLKRTKEAEESYREALRLRPRFPEALNNLGIALENQGKLEQAVEAYREALSIKPAAADVHNNLGVALAAQRKYEEAAESYRQALTLTPDSPLALNNLGNSLRALGQIDESVSCLRRAIRLKPDYAEAYNNLGIALVQQRQDDDAILSYEKALYFRADYPEAHLNRALAWLARGDFEGGWLEYEWRWKAKDVNCRTFRQRRWDGSDLHGRTIFIYFEQGVGDTLQFIRYVRLLKQRGATVIVESQRSLMKLLASCPAIDRLVPTGGSLPDFDLQAPLLSLPGIVGTTIESIPADVPYLFADPQLVAAWRERLAHLEGFRVGIAWQGNPQYRGDRQRSIPLSSFAPLAAIPGIQLISLQKGFGAEQIGELNGKFPVVDLGSIDEEAGAFMDTAAIMQNLDLMITSDTAMPHLAGALGVPVWMAAPRVADWRWMREGDGSPWYPTMRIFRQREADNWDELFARVADALRQQVAARRAKPTKEKVAELDREAESEHQVGLALAKEGRLEEAQYHLQKAIERNPQLVAAHHNLGVIFARQKRLEPAIRTFLKALELDPQYVDAHGNLGLAYFEQGRVDEAVLQFRKSLRLAPGSADTFNNLGVALMQQGRPHEAAKSYRQALQIRPEYIEAHVNLGRALLTLGDFEQGWLEYEWRARLAGDRPSRSRKPQWNGSPLAGRTILLYAEQGLGDTLQFVRYAGLVKEGGGTVVVECQPALAKILASCPWVDKAIAFGNPLPDHDVQAPLLSLPALLRTTIADIPADVPYVSANPQLVEKWNSRLEKLDGLKVGIAWQGNPAWVGDRYRSIPLKHFQALAELRNIRLINLQKGSGAEQLVTAANHFQVVDFGAQVDLSAGPFMDTAAIMQSLDLVVTCDTSIAHLAGALGVPVWVALAYAPDWRWRCNRDDSQWYPTMRLFRQPRPGDWKSVFFHLVRALQKRLATAKVDVELPASRLTQRPDVMPAAIARAAPRIAGERAALTSINLTCPINKLGYGVVGANILKALVRAGVSVACWPIGRVDVQPDDVAIVEEAIQGQATFNGNSPSLRIAHQDQLAQHVGFPRIGFPIFELDRFSAKELNNLRSQDMLFVASRWAQGIVESCSAFNTSGGVHVIPLGVDRQVFCEQAVPEPANGQPRPTVFLSIGKWERRKGHDVLLDAFNKAFGPQDEVELWMLAYNPVITADPNQAGEKNQEWESLYRSSPLGSKIKFLPRLATHREVAATMRQADCGVFLSRAEGWNLPLLEMMSCGRQVIVTNYSAHTEYCDSSNSLLIEIDELEDAYDDRWFFGNGRWAKIGERQIEQAIACMREVHRQKQEGGEMLNGAGVETSKRFGWDATAARIVGLL